MAQGSGDDRPQSLAAGYAAMAADGVREAKARAWYEGLMQDVAAER